MLFNLQHFYAVANNKWTLRNTLFVLLVTTGAFLYLAGMLDSIFNNISSHDLSHGYTPTPSLGLLLPGLRSRAHEKWNKVPASIRGPLTVGFTWWQKWSFYVAFTLYVLSVLFLYFCTNLSLSEQPESLLSKDAAVSISLSLPLCFLLIGRLERYKNLPFWKRFALRLSIFLFFIIFLQLWVHPLGLCVAYIAFRGVSSDGFSVTAKVAETSHVVVTTEQKLEDLQPLFVEVIQNRCLHLPPAVRAHVYSELVKKAETYSRLFLEKGEQFADQLLDMDFLAAKETTTKLLELPILQPQLPVPPAPTPSIIDQTITFITAHPWLALFGITIVGVVVYTWGPKLMGAFGVLVQGSASSQNNNPTRPDWNLRQVNPDLNVSRSKFLMSHIPSDSPALQSVVDEVNNGSFDQLFANAKVSNRDEWGSQRREFAQIRLHKLVKDGVLDIPADSQAYQLMNIWSRQTPLERAPIKLDPRDPLLRLYNSRALYLDANGQPHLFHSEFMRYARLCTLDRFNSNLFSAASALRAELERRVSLIDSTTTSTATSSSSSSSSSSVPSGTNPPMDPTDIL